MKTREKILYVACFVLFFFMGQALALGPVAVFPGSGKGIGVVTQECPTFSWSEAEGAVAYRVEVFELGDGGVVSYEEIRGMASLAISEQVAAPVLSWTPSGRECLEEGKRYVWYVGSLGRGGRKRWSEGKAFEVSTGLTVGAIGGGVVPLALEGANNTLFGFGAGSAITTGTNNTFMGIAAGQNTTGGFRNTFLGDRAGAFNTTASDNTFVGSGAGQSNTGGSNTFMGAGAGDVNGIGAFNTFMGRGAGTANTSASVNTFVGESAGAANTTGNSNTFVGRSAGGSNNTASNNTFMGELAGRFNITGSENTFIGQSTGQSNTTGSFNTFMGQLAGLANTTASFNTFIGASAGVNNTTGAQNTFIGDSTGSSTTTGSENSFMGRLAGNANTTGFSNTFMGASAGSGNSAGANNTFIGRFAGQSNTTASNNTFMGAQAGQANTTGTANTFMGRNAGFSNATGGNNTFIGGAAGQFNTTAFNNTFIGLSAGSANTTGGGNTFVGSSTGTGNTTGFSNTFIGSSAGTGNSTGVGNTYVGASAGGSSLGSNNVFIGSNAGFFEAGSNKLYITNAITNTPLIHGEFDNNRLTVNGNLEVIGPDNGLVRLSDNTTDNTTKVSRMVVRHFSNAQLPLNLFGAASTGTANFVAFGGGNTVANAATQIDLFTAPNTTTPVGIPRLTVTGNGNVGIGTQTPGQPLQMASGAHVTAGGVWTNASSRKYKDNIETLTQEEAFDALRGLNPVKFAYKADRTEKHVGFIAEDVPDLIATTDRKGLSPMDIVAVLTKVVQEQQKSIQNQKETISVLIDELRELKGALSLREGLISAGNSLR